jgi:hypothetical protein
MLNLKSMEGRQSARPTVLWRKGVTFGGVLLDQIWTFFGLVNKRVGKEAHDHSIERSIRASWERFFGFVKFVVGDGRRVQSWHDIWWDLVLKELLSDFFLIAMDKDASI